MKISTLLAAFALSLTGSAGAFAQTYPDKPVKIIVPFNPGGTSDTIMRAMSGKMAEVLGQPVIIENKAGAGGGIGAMHVKHAAPDGYTLLIAPIGTYAIVPVLNKSMQFDPNRDFDLLSIPVRTPNVMVASPSLPVKTFAELVAYMKANPGKVTFASSGVGTTDHLTSALMWKRTQTMGTHVAYKGGAPAVSDLIAGHVDILITNYGNISTYIKSGKVRPLAVTSRERVPELPQTPTFGESGIADFNVYGWQGIAGPRGMPAAVKEKLRNAILAALKEPNVKNMLEPLGYQIYASSSEDFARELAIETTRWTAIIQSEGIVLE